MIAAIPVPFEYVPRMLPIAKPFLERAALRSDGWSSGDIDDSVRGQRSALWVILDGSAMIGAALVELHDEAVYIALVGGVRWREWRNQIRCIEDWAQSTGRKRVEFTGRGGWRVMQRDGYRLADGVWSKDVSHG